MEIKNEHARRVVVGHRVIFQITHPRVTDENAAAIQNALVEGISNFLQEGTEWRRKLVPINSDSRRVTFSTPEVSDSDDSRSFSLIPLTFSETEHAKDDSSQDDVIILLNDAYAELGGLFPIPLKEEQGIGISLKSISPDWLASDLHHGGSTGGPGSIPARKPAPTGAEHKFKLRGTGTLNSLLPHKFPETEAVQVAILDTAISLDEGVSIDGEVIKFPPDIIAMFVADPSMEVVPYLDQQELSDFDPYADWPHHYEMKNHGNFIGSVVRAIAPSVKIYLYEVLNRFGVGSFVSIAQGVLNAVNQRGNSILPPLVINCSFTLDHDLEALALKDHLTKTARKALRTLLRSKKNRELLEISMRDVFNWATELTPNVRVVAAAGNDGKDENANRRPPRYPAAFEKVLSVAALPKGNPRPNGTFDVASYSNLAHSNGSNKEVYSFATFGGDLVNGSSRPKGGVLGVYIGGIPTQNPDGTFNPGPTNTTAWAQWSGTSFAAPIITALLAAPASDLIIGSNSPGQRITGQNENAILVRQG